MPIDEGASERARDRAIDRARQAALEQAIAGIEIEVDDAAVSEVLARAGAWTAGYRVLEVRQTEGELAVLLEVEVDLPRLRKRIAARPSGDRPRGFAWGGFAAEGCAPLAEADVLEPLRAYGIVADTGATQLAVELRCRDQGAVSHTHVRAAVVELRAEARGAVERTLELSSQGFAEGAAEATAIALDQVLAELADSLAVAARGDLELRVEQPWPAPRVGVLESVLREAVLGVDTVELAGVAADGSAVLRLRGALGVEQLGLALREQSFPGFRLLGFRVDSAHALRVRMQ